MRMRGLYVGELIIPRSEQVCRLASIPFVPVAMAVPILRSGPC